MGGKRYRLTSCLYDRGLRPDPGVIPGPCWRLATMLGGVAYPICGSDLARRGCRLLTSIGRHHWGGQPPGRRLPSSVFHGTQWYGIACTILYH